MDRLKWKLLTEIQGRLKAELLESYLEAHGIDTELIQEAIGRTIYPVNVDDLGRVQVFVSGEQFVEAGQLLKIFNEGVQKEGDDSSE
jgi:hypothetical protein